VPKGQKSLQEDRKRKDSEFTLSRDLKLKDDAKIARIRFLTDTEDFYWAYFHPVLTPTRLGKKYTKLYYCLRQDGKECELCANPETMAVKKRIFFWTYVYGIYHLDADSEGKWEKVEYEGTDFFLEPVNAVKLLNTGPGQNNIIEGKFDKWGKKYKTLCDRDYNWGREGSTMNDTVYDLVPVDEGKSPVSDDIKKAMESLVPLEKIIEAMKPPAGGLGLAKPKSDKADGDADKDEDNLF
jgi:hypothetical protein